jgi:hypothetical protein
MRRGRRRYVPYAFTKQGVAMLSSQEDLRRKIDGKGKRYQARFRVVFETIPQTPASANSGEENDRISGPD